MSLSIHVPRFRDLHRQGPTIVSGLGGIVRKVEAFRGREVPGTGRPEKFQILMRATGRVIEEFGTRAQVDDWLVEHGSRLYNVRRIPARNNTLLEKPGSRHLLCAEIPNLVTNNGLDLKGSSGSFIQSCSLGTGTTPPAVGDSALVAYDRTEDTIVSVTTSARGSAPYYGYQTFVYRFNPPGTNDNYTEIGFHPDGGSTNLFSRVLTEVGGSPVAISVLADEYLDVTYELRMYPYAVTQDVDGGTVDGYSLTYGAIDVDFASPSGWGDRVDDGVSAWSTQWTGYEGASFAGPTSNMSGTQLTIISGGGSWGSYSAGTYNRTATYHAGISQNNGDLNGAVFFSGLGRYGVLFNPFIPKTVDDSLDISINYTWTRATI
jgi:hypothetical protein